MTNTPQCNHTNILPNGMCGHCAQLVAIPVFDWRQPNYIVQGHKTEHRKAYYAMRPKFLANRSK